MRGSFCATLALSLSLKGEGMLHISFQVSLPLRFRESLDRVAKHRPGHSLVARL